MVVKLEESAPVSAAAEQWDCLMGTLVQQQTYGLGGAQCIELARDEIARLELLWSEAHWDSEVSHITRDAGLRAYTVSPDTTFVLSQAKELHALTDGAFDVTAGPLVQLWKYAVDRGAPPTASEIAQARELVSMQDLEVVGPRVSLRRAGQLLDLGSVDKGYAADRCIELYRQHGIRHALVDLGGHVAVLGGKPDGSAWRVGIQAPGHKRGVTCGVIEACDCAVVTTGNYERTYDLAGQPYSHILDPRTGYPVRNDLLSATVVHQSAFFADAFSTACMVLGAERSLELAQRLEVDVFLLCEDGWKLTPGMRRIFHVVD
jgi:thiamine biosynthesis lipoprotein